MGILTLLFDIFTKLQGHFDIQSPGQSHAQISTDKDEIRHEIKNGFPGTAVMMQRLKKEHLTGINRPLCHARIQWRGWGVGVGGGGGGRGHRRSVSPPTPHEKSQSYEFLSNTGPDSVKNHHNK